MFVVSTMETVLMKWSLRSEVHGFYSSDIYFLGGKAFLLCNRNMWKTVFNLIFLNLFVSGNHINLK